MKIRSFLTIVLVAGVSIFSFAEKEPSAAGFAVLSVKGTEVFKVIYKSEVSERVKLSVYDAKSNLVYTESIVGSGFILPLNFKQLAPGEYSVEVASASGKRTEKIVYQPVAESKFFNVAKLSGQRNKFLLTVSGEDLAGKINVRIFDGSDNLLHSEEKEIAGEFAQIYNVKNFSNGLTFEISDSTGKTKVMSF